MKILVLLLLVAAAAAAGEFTDEELSNFPKLFHLDDYDRCLAKKNGVYCLGSFELTPDVQPNPTYDLLKEYSDKRHFNRTRIHRGYCVSSRCPNLLSNNASLRFERCVDEWAQARTLRASINKLHYCRTHADKHAVPPMTDAQRLFLQCVVAIVALNIIGTIYDVYMGDEPEKNKLITAFSIPANWRRLSVIHEGGDPRLTALIPVNGVRVISMAFTTFAHANVFHSCFYTLNPEYLEKQSQRLDAAFLAGGTALMQMLAALACFFTAYNLLIFSQKRDLTFNMLPLCLLKRIIRISPVHIFLVGFAATWWPHLRDGPLVSTTIGIESAACQKKFWYHVFYVNNAVDKTDYCIAPTWFLAVDFHLYILACSLTLLLWRQRCRALKLYVVLFFASCIFCGIVAYFKEFKAFIYFAIPESIRQIFRNEPSFTSFYLSSWSSIPSCFVGLILAHIQFELDEKRIKLNDYKWFRYLHHFTFPFLFIWQLSGQLARNISSPIFSAVYVAFDRPFYCILGGITLLGLVNVDGPLRKFFGWSGWTKLARVSLTVMMFHWCINMMIAARPVAYGTSFLDMTVDWIATNFITYVLAIPITIMLEIPMQKFLGLLIF
ncbi:uncharacterized protein LOC142981820 [Anticarsia gemmatalis]|uniref:uncharacterized protein LOC142981820 n=1 Tax=Anticarsia gemmatalis TaxID=129554 RepID=UPI003F75B277